MDPQTVIRVVSDVVCPWCYIGKRRLEKALDLLGKTDVQVHWTAFQLNPGAPSEGWNRRAYRATKFGSLEVASRLEERVVTTAAQEGLHFRFDLVERTPNTFDAHRLIWLAGTELTQNTVVESLFHAYFMEGRNIGDQAVLREIGMSSGLDAGLVDQLFDTNLGFSEVTRDEEWARAQGVSGVPTLFLNGEALTSGAHPSQLLASMLSPQLCATAR